jgi:hypothetical protein
MIPKSVQRFRVCAKHPRDPGVQINASAGAGRSDKIMQPGKSP